MDEYTRDELRAEIAKLKRKIEEDRDARYRRMDADEALTEGRTVEEVVLSEIALRDERDRLRAKVAELNAIITNRDRSLADERDAAKANFDSEFIEATDWLDKFNKRGEELRTMERDRDAARAERDALRAEVERLRCSCHQTQDEEVRNRTCPVHRDWIARFAEIERERDAARAEVERLRDDLTRLYKAKDLAARDRDEAQAEVARLHEERDAARQDALSQFRMLTAATDERDAARAALLGADLLLFQLSARYGFKYALDEATAAALQAAKEASKVTDELSTTSFKDKTMTNEPIYTPPPVTGYRKLSQGDVDLMNEVKAAGEQMEAICNRLECLTCAPVDAGLTKSVDGQWLAIGKTHLQQGLMALVRAVAQPGSF